MIQDRAIVTRKPYPSFRMIPFSMTLSDLDWLNEIFNDIKHACSLSATAELLV